MYNMSMLIGGVFADNMIKLLTSELFIIFVVLVVGYLIGRINIKGIALGSSGVFIVALIAGVLLSKYGDKIGFDWFYTQEPKVTGNINNPEKIKYELATIKTFRDLGLGMFVAGIGFIAGPTFIKNFKNKAVSYLGIGVSIIIIATIFCIAIIALDKSLEAYQGVGILMGALSTTPGLSSAQSVFAENSSEIAALSGLTYPFGVLGVVLFVQFMPKILRVDMAKEIEKLKASSAKKVQASSEAKKKEIKRETSSSANASELPLAKKELLKFDSLGLCIFSLAVAIGMIIGAIAIPMGGGLKFSLGTTGGALLTGLLFAHFGKIGRVSLEVPKSTLSVMRELGLIFFLTCSGIEGGFKFLDEFKWHYLLYGAFLTMVPMIIGYFIAKRAFKLELLNNLGSISGAMTSTPALGALIHVSKTEEVAQSYAATYPISLFLLVFVPQIIYLIF